MLEQISGAHIYGVLISCIFLGFIVTLIISVYRNKSIKISSILVRDDGRVSKIAIAFLFILPIIIYQAIYLDHINPELESILITIMGAEIGVKFTDKLPDILGRKREEGPKP